MQLRKRIGREEFDYPLLKSALSAYSAVDRKINQLLQTGRIVRVKKGLYVFSPDVRQAPVCKESLANLIYGPSCISMEYALSFHGLIRERFETITSVTPKRDKEFSTPLGRFTYRYLNPTKYRHGIEQQWIDRQHPILIATAEKALFDYITLNDISLPDNRAAVRQFLESDLRIDEDALKRLDLKQLFRLNQHYKSPAIERIMDAL